LLERPAMQITVLTYVDPADGRDEVVDQVVETLSPRHDVRVLEIHDDIQAMIAELVENPPDLVFNLCEMFGDDVRGDFRVAGVLELLKLPFTGSGAAELYVTQDKGLSKKLLAFEGVLYPNFAIFSADSDLETGGNLRMPLFVKPLRTDASIGIGSGADALVRDWSGMMKRVETIHRECKDAALAEEYIEGRELYVAVIGNREVEALPPIELDLSGLPDSMPAVAGADVKFDEELGEKYNVEARVADLPDELRARLQKVAIQAYRALRVRDYGRVDLRLTEAGEIYVLEVNANCYLERDSETAMAAEAAGYDYAKLLQRIVELALERQPEQVAHVRSLKRKSKRVKKARAVRPAVVPAKASA
jgi:D-alanine-D-alanine ligase